MKNKLNSRVEASRRWIAIATLLILGAAWPASASAAAAHETLWDTLKAGGPMLILIGILSVLTVGLILECSFRLRVTKAAPKNIVDLLQKAITDGNYQEAWRVCDKNPTFMTNVLKPAIQRVGRADEVAALTQFLLSPEAGFIHASVFFIDGGIGALMHPMRF